MKKKILSVLTVIFILMSTAVQTFAVSGKGTEANPFRLSTSDDLLLLADFPECYFELENDIDFTGTWEPIADFSGHFDGKGHTITVSGFMLKANTGFFGTLSGTVENLTLHANSMTLKCSYTHKNIGLFAGVCSGSISNCKATGSLTCDATPADKSSESAAKSKYFGGICGESTGTIENTVAQYETFAAKWVDDSSNINNGLYTGGICGNLLGSLSQCANMSSVTLKAYSYSYHNSVCFGGIASKVGAEATISDSMNLETAISTITTSSYYNYYGGIAYSNSGTITNCYSVGGNATMFGKYGITKNESTGTMENCYYDKVVLGDSSVTYGEPKSTIAMQMEATYKNWDFDTIWAIDESEENPINGGYPYLQFLYQDVSRPITMSSASLCEGNIVIDSKITDVSTTCVLHIALYDASNKLCGYIILPNDRQLKDVFAVYPDNGTAAYAKIFAWSALEAMTPVAEYETVQIVR